MSYKTCEECGTRLSEGMCPNCQEELFIFETQSEWAPDELSEEFMGKVREQRAQVKR